MANAFLLRPLAAAASSPHTGAGSPDYLFNDYFGLIWRSAAGIGVPYLRIDLGADTKVDTVMLFGVEGAPRGTSGWQVYGSTAAEGPVRARADGGSTLYAGQQPLPSGKGVALSMLPAAWPAIRHIDIEIGAGGAAVQIARVVIGQRLTLARNFGLAAAYGIRDFGSLDFGPLATLLRRRGARLRTVGLTFSSIYKDEVEAAVAPLLARVGNTEPVALVSDPAADAMRERRCWFGPLVGELGYIGVKPGLYEAKASLIDLDPILS